MTSTKYQLGSLITQRREKYDGDNIPIRGVSREGFITPKQSVTDLRLYNLFYLGDFVFNPARMEVNSIAYNKFIEKGTCSSLYEVFYVSRPDILLPEYLNLFVKRDEFARMCSYIGWGSAREYCRVSNISEIPIELPPIEIQRKYVAIYESVRALQLSCESALSDLKLVCDAQLQLCKDSKRWITLGDVFEERDERNADLECTVAHGINVTKQFMISHASIGDLRTYKLVHKMQFAYSSMQTGRDRCIRIALNDGDGTLAVSPAYSVLVCKRRDVDPEYVMMWMSRAESDRLGWFCSDGSIRANLDLDRFFEIRIPLPDENRQQALVNLYSALRLRRRMNDELKTRLISLSPVLIKGAMDEARR